MLRWFRKKDVNSSPLNHQRYRGKPLLFLLEFYVLDCIGSIPEDKEFEITAAVKRVFGGGDDWKATMRAALLLDEALDERIRTMWERNQTIARQAGQSLPPDAFARMLVDENFASLIGS